MANRRNASAVPRDGALQSPVPSGPRDLSLSAIFRANKPASGGKLRGEWNPAKPHMARLDPLHLSCPLMFDFGSANASLNLAIFSCLDPYHPLLQRIA